MYGQYNELTIIIYNCADQGSDYAIWSECFPAKWFSYFGQILHIVTEAINLILTTTVEIGKNIIIFYYGSSIPFC